MKGYTCDGQMSIFDILGQEPREPSEAQETEKPQMAAVKNECGEWVKEHGKRLMFEELEENKFYIHDYSTTSNEFFKVVYTKRKTEDTIMYVDSPRGIKAEWSWGNSFSALSRKEWVNGEECHCGWFYEMPTEGKQMGWPLDIRGLCDDGYCPNCDHAFDQYLHPDEIDCEVCPECGTPLDWTRWHKMNDPELKDKYPDLDTRYINPDTREIEDHPFEWNYTDTDPPKIEDIYFGCIISKDNAGEDMYTYTTIRFMDGVYWIFNHSNKEWLTLAKGDTVIAWREYTSSELNTIRDYDSMVIHEIEEEDGERDQEDM